MAKNCGSSKISSLGDFVIHIKYQVNTKYNVVRQMGVVIGLLILKQTDNSQMLYTGMAKLTAKSLSTH